MKKPLDPLGLDLDSEPVLLDLDKLIGSHACVVANAGAGKSGLIRRILEITYGQVQHIILDAEDEFYTLREHYPDYLIAGGEGGDTPATVANAEMLAETALQHGISMIVQLNDLRSSEQERFISKFIDTMMAAPRDQWRPILVALDEAHRWAPQDGYSGASAAVKDLTSRGRKRGYTALLATQRMAKIDKNVTGDVNNWFIGRVGQGTDRRVAADALGFTPNSLEGRGLQTLDVRKFWCFGVATRPISTPFVVAKTETTMVRSGQMKVPTPPAGKALQRIVASLAKVARDAEAAEVAKKAATQAVPAEVMPDEQEAMDKARAAGRQEGYEEGKRDGYAEGDTNGYRRAYSEACGDVRPLLQRFEALAYDADVKTGEVDIPAQPEPPALAPEPVEPKKAAPKIPFDPSTFTITPAYQKILDALAWGAKLKRDPSASMSKKTLGFLVGMAHSAGGFNNYLGKLRAVGLIHYPVPNEVALTDAGQSKAATPRAITPKQVQDMAMDRLPPGRLREILEILLEAYPSSMTKAKLAERIGMQATAGGFNNYLGRLRSLDMVTYPVANEAKASDLLFPPQR